MTRGDKLPPHLQQQVLLACGYRWTIENQRRAARWLRGAAPRREPVRDEDWLRQRWFPLARGGRALDVRQGPIAEVFR